MMNPISKEECHQIGPPAYICVAPITLEDTEKYFGIKFETEVKDGFCEASNASIELDGTQLWVRTPVNFLSIHEYLCGRFWEKRC